MESPKVLSCLQEVWDRWSSFSFSFFVLWRGFKCSFMQSSRGQGNKRSISVPARSKDYSLVFCRWLSFILQVKCSWMPKKFSSFWYKATSRQQVNKAKTTIFFSWNTPKDVQQEIKVLLGVSAIKHYDKHLGLLSFLGRQKKACFNQIKERIWNKMQGWEERLLSQAGKEVMIKAVIQSIPTYSMNVFHLPLGLIKDIELMINKFWWGTKIIQGRCNGWSGELFAPQNLLEV